MLLAVYVGLSFLNSPRGFPGTDTGGKVATLQVMDESGRFDPDHGYGAEEWDPAGSLHPLAYTSHTASGKWVNVTALPAPWIGWQLYRVGEYRAALLVPMAGAVAACFAGLALLRRLRVGERHAWHGFGLLGLASLLTIYALDFREHSLGVACIAWALVLFVDTVAGSRSWPAVAGAGAGLLFGAAATMRTEALVYLATTAAVLLLLQFFARSGAPWPPNRAQILRSAVTGSVLLVAAIAPLAVNEVAERAVVGSTIRSSRVAGTASTVADAPAGRLEEAATTVVGLEGSTAGIILGAGFVLLLGFAAVRSDLAWSPLPLPSPSPSPSPSPAAWPLSGSSPAASVAALGRRPDRLKWRSPAWPWPSPPSASPWLGVRSHDVDRTIATLEARPEPVIVSGLFHLAREGGRHLRRQAVAHADPDGRRRPGRQGARRGRRRALRGRASQRTTPSRLPASRPKTPLTCGSSTVSTSW